MKKLILIATFLVCSLATMAQVEIFEGSLKEAIEKAKNEDKTVLIMASTTWCGPCKSVVANVLPTKEAGDYFNPDYIYIKYELDEADPDNVTKTYNVKAYPTFIFIDGNGEEVTRVIGGTSDPKLFINRIKEVVKPENSFKARYARFQSDPSYSMTYITFLEDCYMNDEAAKLFNELFEKRSLKDNFTADNMKIYEKRITSTDSPIFKAMINNEKEIKAIIGEDAYTDFMHNKSASFLMGQIFSSKFNVEKYNKVVTEINSTKQLQSNYTKFIFSNKQAILDRDYKTLIPVATKALVKADSKTREQIIRLTTMTIPRSEAELSKQTAISLYEAAMKLEKDPEAKKRYEGIIDGIKNPKSIPTMRMV